MMFLFFTYIPIFKSACVCVSEYVIHSGYHSWTHTVGKHKQVCTTCVRCFPPPLRFGRCTNRLEFGLGWRHQTLCPQDNVKWSLTCISAFCLRPPTDGLFSKVTRLLWSLSSAILCGSCALTNPCCIMGQRGSFFFLAVTASSPAETVQHNGPCISPNYTAHVSDISLVWGSPCQC